MYAFPSNQAEDGNVKPNIMRWNIRSPSFLTRPWCKDIKIQNIYSKLMLLFLVKKCIFRLTQFMKKENNYKERREGWLHSIEMCQAKNTTKIVFFSGKEKQQVCVLYRLFYCIKVPSDSQTRWIPSRPIYLRYQPLPPASSLSLSQT